jgi:hypothetical protein
MLISMAALEDRPQMQVADFEALAAFAARLDDAPSLEFVGGKVGVKAVPDGTHGTIIAWLIRVFGQRLPDLWFYPEQGLRIEPYRTGRARPDGVLARAAAFVGDGEWAAADDVLLAVEVTSFDRDSHRRDCENRVLAYAETDIPVYLLIDRAAERITVYSEPVNGKYERAVSCGAGEKIQLPAPVSLILDTEPLREWIA